MKNEVVIGAAAEIIRDARKVGRSVETLDGPLCPVCASGKADDEPESITAVSLAPYTDCYNCEGANERRY